MSIDTSLKRASAANDQFVQFLPPEPSGSIGAAERAIVVWAYAGLDYEAPVEPSAEPGIIVYSRASSATTNQAKMSGVSQGSARSSGAAQSYSR